MKIEKDDITTLPEVQLLRAYRSVGTPMICNEHYTTGELEREILRRLNLGKTCQIRDCINRFLQSRLHRNEE